jgi:hypothetical protein
MFNKYLLFYHDLKKVYILKTKTHLCACIVFNIEFLSLLIVSILHFIRACNFKYIAIQWDQPKQYGDARIIGYKVYVNGVVEAVLGPDTFSFTYSHGKWCKEYSFQVQVCTI